MLKIMQWNMGGAPHARTPKPHPNAQGCADALTELLREHQPAVVALQEATDELLALAKLTTYDVQRGPLGLTTLLHRQQYRIVENRAINQRVQAVQIDSLVAGSPGLAVFNVHLPVLYKSEAERRDSNRILLSGANIADFLVKVPNKLEIIVGDFNLPPYDEFIVGKSGLFANRDLLHISSSRNTVERALYNVSWCIFGGRCGALGTYHADSIPHGPWQVPDQMLLHPKLVERQQVRVEVLTRLTHKPSHRMGTSGGRPSKKHTSDHFPVLVTVSAPVTV